MDIDRINVYRMIHIDNIPHVLDYGVTSKHSINSNNFFRPIGDALLINTRNIKEVIVDNGELFSENATKIRLGDFIPFYFGIRMPMLYVIQFGGNFVEEKTKPEDIVYIVCSLRSIVDHNLKFYFSDGHATDNLTTFYDDKSVVQIGQIIDWDAVRIKYWAGQENLNAKRMKQAELLVKDDIPVKCIRGYVTYNAMSKDRLVNLGIDEGIIKVFPKAYF